MIKNINRLIEKYKDTDIYPLLQKYYVNDSFDEQSLVVLSENVKEMIFSYNMSKYPYHVYVGNDKQDNLLLALKSYYNLEQKVRVKDGKLKIYPADLSEEQHEQIYVAVIRGMVDYQFESGMDMDDIIDEVTENINQSHEEYKNDLTKMDMEPFYGSPKYLIGRADFIKKCISEIPGVYLSVDEILEKMHSFEEKYMKNDANNWSEAISGVGEEFYADYDILETCYKAMLDIEEELSPIVFSFWHQYLTNPNQHDANSYRYIMHSFSGGLVAPDAMHKACCSLNTDELVITPYGNTGLIYDVTADSVETFCSEDAGSWSCDKKTFFDRGCPCRWQLTNPDGLSVWYEFCENSKLLMPEILEKQCKDINREVNGEILNNQKGNLYSEIYLNKNARPVGVFYTDECTNYEEIAVYAEMYNLPLINISLAKQRELKGMEPLDSRSKH